MSLQQHWQPRPWQRRYLRQLDVTGVDTKFIEARKGLLTELLDHVLPPEALDTSAPASRNFEQRYGLASKPPQIRFRILDRRLSIRGLTDLAVTAREFSALVLQVVRVVIPENEDKGLAFPALAGSLVFF